MITAQFGVRPNPNGHLARKLAQREIVTRREIQARTRLAESEARARRYEAEIEEARRREAARKAVLQRLLEADSDWEKALIIQRLVAAEHGVTVNDLTSESRRATLAAIRLEAYWRIACETGLSFPRIGRLFGGRDHTTVQRGIISHCRRNRIKPPRGIELTTLAPRKR